VAGAHGLPDGVFRSVRFIAGLNGHAPEDILGKYEGTSLAELYAAIAHALSNREDIAAEIDQEDELERVSRTSSVPT
jgi:hypothetical protein